MGTRTGPDAGRVEDLWGTSTSVTLTGAGYLSVRTGASGNHVNGVPIDAVRGSVATTICGVRDAAGQHGVVIELTIAVNGQYTDSALRLSPWTTP